MIKRRTHTLEVKAQSAMEYLMTYGWAILIISIVLVALWSIGVFSSPGGGGGAACVGTIGYLCGTPTLESNGLLLTTIGQTSSSGTLSVTGLGCSNSSTQPSTFSSTSISLAPSQVASAAFSCALPNSAMGATFTGTLWIQYNLGTATGLISRVGAVNTKITMQGSSIALITGNYVPITLTNLQSTATGANFQQMITVGTSYTAYGELANMQNVEFTTGIGGTGTILQAWCESSCTSSSTSTWWVNLASDTMAASPGPGNSITVYMDFMPSSVMSSSGPTGEAPQISGTYAQYDNGGSVFPYYQRWGGLSSLPAGWTGLPSSTITFSAASTFFGVPCCTQSAYGAYETAPSSINTIPTIMEFYGNMYDGTPTGQFFGTFTSSSLNNFAYAIVTGFGGSTYLEVINAATPVISSGISSTNNNQVYSLAVDSSTTATIYDNYAKGTQATGLTAVSQPYFAISPTYFPSIGSTGITVYWVRSRVYPPSSMMPTVSLGTAV